MKLDAGTGKGPGLQHLADVVELIIARELSVDYASQLSPRFHRRFVKYAASVAVSAEKAGDPRPRSIIQDDLHRDPSSPGIRS